MEVVVCDCTEFVPYMTDLGIALIFTVEVRGDFLDPSHRTDGDVVDGKVRSDVEN